MVAIICLLLYFNLYYENCFRDTCLSLSKFKMCSCLKYFFARKPNSTNSNNRKVISNTNNKYKETSRKEIFEI